MSINTSFHTESLSTHVFSIQINAFANLHIGKLPAQWLVYKENRNQKNQLWIHLDSNPEPPALKVGMF